MRHPATASLCAAALAALAFAAALAAGTGPPAPPLDCAHAQTQTDLNACAARDAQRAEAKLEATYARVRAKYPNGPLSGDLSASQAAWLAFRKAECRFAADRWAGGSIQPMQRYGCLATLTQARAKALASYLSEGQ